MHTTPWNETALYLERAQTMGTMDDLLDVLEEYTWLDSMNEQGLLNARGQDKLKKYRKYISRMSAIVEG